MVLQAHQFTSANLHNPYYCRQAKLSPGLESILKKVKKQSIFDSSPKSKEIIDFDDRILYSILH